MSLAAFRFLAGWAVVAATVSCLLGADSGQRSAPQRPGAGPAAPAPTVTSKVEAKAETARPATKPTSSAGVPSRKFGAIEYVKLAEGGARLGLKASLSKNKRTMILSGQNVKAELDVDSRDITVNGLRVFLGDKVEDAGGELYVSRVDFERCLTPLLRPGFGVGGLQTPKIVVLDPGHGGRDNGTSINEKVYALDVAKRAKAILERVGYKVILTRNTDVYVDLVQRPALANLEGADLFVSIHFNAVPRDKQVSGFEIYTFPPQYQRSTKSWSPGEGNDAETEAVAGNRYDHWNVVLAQALHKRFVGELRATDRGKKIYHLAVLRSLNCPGVLLECGFLTSDAEAKKIATPAYRERLADAIADGVKDYATTLERSRPARTTAATAAAKGAVVD